MNELAHKSLLPAGIQDVLPPDAAHEAEVAARLLGVFASHGYERVKPPLVEFEEGLLSGTGAALANQTFRLMDPISQRMMAVRSDVTPQVARIAQGRLSRAPRPLRLSYAEDILRVRGTELRAERQFGQVGYELIGAEGAAADAEVILLAVEALSALGLGPLSVDLNAPTLVTSLLDALALDAGTQHRLREALDHKDAAEVERNAGAAAPVFRALLAATGVAGPALERLAGLKLPGAARREADALSAVAGILLARGIPGLSLTVDPVEHRGFEYQTGVSFSLFGIEVREELGRGGRYEINGVAGIIEPATGCTLYMDELIGVLGGAPPVKRLYQPYGTDAETGRRLRAEGYVTVAGLAPVGDIVAEARRLGCAFVLKAGKPVAVTRGDGSDG
ncbi:MAG: ATP phosphoribosyltransferase regulatory subunit [Alphaproteobacteria bacterium]